MLCDLTICVDSGGGGGGHGRTEVEEVRVVEIGGRGEGVDVGMVRLEVLVWGCSICLQGIYDTR